MLQHPNETGMPSRRPMARARVGQWHYVKHVMSRKRFARNGAHRRLGDGLEPETAQIHATRTHPAIRRAESRRRGKAQKLARRRNRR